MQNDQMAEMPSSSGNRLFPLSPKAIRLLRAHDKETFGELRLSQGTGEINKTSDKRM